MYCHVRRDVKGDCGARPIRVAMAVRPQNSTQRRKDAKTPGRKGGILVISFASLRPCAFALNSFCWQFLLRAVRAFGVKFLTVPTFLTHTRSAS